MFDGARDAKDLLMRLSLVTKQPLEKGRTIIFLDEVQEFKDIVTRVKFLVEDGSYRYIMSGSLLGVELNDLRSAPVGYLRVYDMYPMDLCEFMVSVGANTIFFIQSSFLSNLLQSGDEKSVQAVSHLPA